MCKFRETIPLSSKIWSTGTEYRYRYHTKISRNEKNVLVLGEQPVFGRSKRTGEDVLPTMRKMMIESEIERKRKAGSLYVDITVKGKGTGTVYSSSMRWCVN
jgi:hypothetical protein